MAAALVVGYHAVLVWTFFGPGTATGILGQVFSAGWVGVDFFFVLSAFLLALPFLRDRGALREPGAVRRFLVSRWLRVAPAYYVSMLIPVFAFASASPGLVDPTNFTLHLTFLHGFAPQWFDGLNIAYWSLSVEAQFYLILPLMLAALSAKRWPWVAVGLFALSLGWLAVFYSATDPRLSWWYREQLPPFFGHFGIGIVAARLYREQADSKTLKAWLTGIIALFLGLGFIAVLAIPVDTMWKGPGATYAAHVLLRPLLAVAFAAVILAAALYHGAWSRILASAPAEGLGKISYSLYLVHLPIQLLLLGRVVEAVPSFLAFLAVSTAASLCGAMLLYLTIEAPALRLRTGLPFAVKRRAAAPRLPAPPLSASPRPAIAGEEA